VRVRDARKQASRARVIQAARVLFEEVGFQETTVRMIAERAGLSPGGVFTTFDDKIAILCQILAEQRETLLEEIERLVPTLRGSVRERLQAVIALAHAHEAPRLRMVVAYIGASYGWSRKLEDQYNQLHRRLRRVVDDLLRAAQDAGEIRPEIDLELAAEMITAVYERNYRSAYYADHGVAELDGSMAQQLDILFDGCCSR
jgi:AcrR family transcriptional regulator